MGVHEEPPTMTPDAQSNSYPLTFRVAALVVVAAAKSGAVRARENSKRIGIAAPPRKVMSST